MTKFENDALQKLLLIKAEELRELAKDKGLKIKSEAVEEVANLCEKLFGEITFIEAWKYNGF